MEMDVARGLAAQCWCDPRTSDRVMDPDLAEVFAEILQKLSELDPEIMEMIDTLNAEHGRA